MCSLQVNWLKNSSAKERKKSENSGRKTPKCYPRDERRLAPEIKISTVEADSV